MNWLCYRRWNSINIIEFKVVGNNVWIGRQINTIKQRVQKKIRFINKRFQYIMKIILYFNGEQMNYLVDKVGIVKWIVKINLKI